MACLRHGLRGRRGGLRRPDPGADCGERRGLSPVRGRQQRQGPRRPHGHQVPAGGRRRRPGAVGAGDEGGLPAAGGRGAQGVRRARRPGTSADPGRLQPGPVSRRAGGAERCRAGCAGPQTAPALHARRLHGRGRRPGGGRPSRADDRGRVRGPVRRHRRRPRRRPGRPGQHQLPAGPCGTGWTRASPLRGDRRRHELGQVPRRRARPRRERGEPSSTAPR